MTVTCAIVNCFNRGGRDKVSFYRIPNVREDQGQKTYELLTKRRRLWMAAIGRADLSGTDGKKVQFMRVCSAHFVCGKPAELYDNTNPDWIPTQNLGKQQLDVCTTSSRRHQSVKRREDGKKAMEAAQTLLALNDSFSVPKEIQIAESSPEQDIPVLTDAEKLKEANDKYDSLFAEYTLLKHKLKKTQCAGPEDFENDNDKVRYYTGLNSYAMLMALFNLVQPVIPHNASSSLSKFQKLLLTLSRYRLNDPINRLSYAYGISKSTVSRVFSEMTEIFYVRLQPLIYWPEKDELYETMPMVFRQHFRKKVSVIMDCFEIFIDKPSNLEAKCQSFSNYKSHNTAKYLLGITPQGSISYISSGWGGRVSDKHLTANSDMLDKLVPGDFILADRGFAIDELVALLGASVVIPSFTRGKKQLSGKDVESTRRIANVRIHVERVIGSVRQKYSILSSNIPIDYVITKTDRDICMLDKIVFICCALTNMCPSVVPFD